MKSFAEPGPALLSILGLLGLAGCSAPASTEGEGGTSSLTAVAGTPIVSGIGAKCLDDSGDQTANGNKIQLWQCNGTGAQDWSYTKGTLVGPGGKCLDIQPDYKFQGTIVQMSQ